MRKKIFISFIALLAFILVVWISTSDLDRIALINTHGQKSSGSLADVSVGEDWQSAASTLRKKGMISANYADDGSCPMRGNFDKILVFVDVSWRKGTICIGIIKGKVASFAWRYNFFQS